MTKLSRAGKETTAVVLESAFHFAQANEIKTVVVASTGGETGVLAAKIGAKQGTDVIVVTHNTGFAKPGAQELDAILRERILEFGARIHTGTLVMRGLGSALHKRYGGSEEEVVASVLRLFGQGMKVCVEMASMVADAGLIPPADIICVGGTGRGADTAASIYPAASNAFFDTKIRHVIVKPTDF